MSSRYSRRYETEKNSPGIFFQNKPDYQEKSHQRRQYKSAHRTHDIFNRAHVLESNEGVSLLVSRLRSQLKASKLRSYELIFIANSLVQTFQLRGAVSGEDLSQLLQTVMVNWNLENCSSISRRFLGSAQGIVELVHLLKGKISNRKQTMEMKLWQRMDFHARAFSYYGNLLNLFKADYHPLVMTRRRRTVQVEKEFKDGLALFDQIKGFLLKTKGVPDGGDQSSGSAEQLEMKVLKHREFVEWFSFFCFEEDDDYKFETLFKDVFGF